MVQAEAPFENQNASQVNRKKKNNAIVTKKQTI